MDLIQRIAILFFFTSILTYSPLIGQDIVRFEDLNRKCRKMYTKATEAQKINDFSKASQAYAKVLKRNPHFVEAKIKMAQIEYQSQNIDKAKQAYADIISEYTEYEPNIYLAYGTILKESGEYQESIVAFQEYLTLVPNGRRNDRIRAEIEQMKFIVAAQKEKVEFKPRPLSDKVNTLGQEYEASFTADETKMYFTRLIKNQEDFYVAHIVDGVITSVSPLVELNTPLNEGAHTISSDGSELIFTVCDDRRTFGGCDLYVSTLVNDRWSKPTNLGQVINTEAAETQPSLSGDGQTLYFASTRPGGLGGSDIWFSKRDDKLNWTTPQNLGSDVNTTGNEETPFIHKDNLTLFFSSNGRPGMGKLDLYVARRSLWNNEWDSIQHMPYPINTTSDDRGLKVSLNGNKAYFSSDRIEYKKLDLYEFDLPENLKPVKSEYLNILVRDSDTNEPIAAKIEITDLNNPGHILMTTASSIGKAVVTYPSSISLGIKVSADEYNFYSGHIPALEKSSEEQSHNLEVYLSRLRNVASTGFAKATVLNNIFFESGSAELKSISYSEIDHLYQLLINNEKIRIKIIGHTDSVGTPTDNLSLSAARAKAVFTALLDKGIDSSRVTYEGKGESSPIASNDTAEGKKQNRRTEFIIY